MKAKSWVRRVNKGRATSQARETRASASMIAKLTHTIQPLLPVSQSATGPGAQPFDLARGERMPQPRSAPKNMWEVVARPMIMPWPA